jgi:hypothetical protein
VISEPENGGTAEPNLVYLLEVGVAREAIDVWHAWRPGRSPSLDDQLQAVIYYAENDAWLPVE